jgi:hypothetical protein
LVWVGKDGDYTLLNVNLTRHVNVGSSVWIEVPFFRAVSFNLSQTQCTRYIVKIEFQLRLLVDFELVYSFLRYKHDTRPHESLNQSIKVRVTKLRIHLNNLTTTDTY